MLELATIPNSAALSTQEWQLMAFDKVRLRELRIKRRMSVGQLAALIGVKHPTISRYESGKVTPKTARVIQLARVLETTREYLEGETDDPAFHLTFEELDPEERELVRRWRRMNAEHKNRFLWELFREDNGG